VSFALTGDDVRVTFLNDLAGLDTNWAFTLMAEADSHYIAVAAPRSGDDVPRFSRAHFGVDLLP
jgi:hypothetical protein